MPGCVLPKAVVRGSTPQREPRAPERQPWGGPLLWSHCWSFGFVCLESGPSLAADQPPPTADEVSWRCPPCDDSGRHESPRCV